MCKWRKEDNILLSYITYYEKCIIQDTLVFTNLKECANKLKEIASQSKESWERIFGCSDACLTLLGSSLREHRYCAIILFWNQGTSLYQHL